MEVTLASSVESLLHLLQILPRICLIQQQENLPTATPKQTEAREHLCFLSLIRVVHPYLHAKQPHGQSKNVQLASIWRWYSVKDESRRRSGTDSSV